MTVILQLDSSPFDALAVIQAVPFPTAFTFPFLSTVSIPELDVLKATDLSDALAGETVAVSVTVSPLPRLREDLFSDILVTGTGGSSSLNARLFAFA